LTGLALHPASNVPRITHPRACRLHHHPERRQAL
jgi:hypothetical protein